MKEGGEELQQDGHVKGIENKYGGMTDNRKLTNFYDK